MQKKEFKISDFMDLPKNPNAPLHLIRRWFIRRFFMWLPHSLTWRTSVKGIHYAFPFQNHIGKGMIMDGGFEVKQVLYFFTSAREGGADTLLDIGANIGLYSFIGAKTKYFQEIHAVEPHPKTYQLLLWGIEKNNLREFIIPHNTAASAQDGEMFIDVRNRGMARVSPTLRPKTVAVKAMPLDSVFKFSGRRIAVKIDVEGHEKPVLHGMRNMLVNNAMLLQIEIWDESPDCANYLLDNGFRLIYRIGNDAYFANDKWCETGG